MEIPVFSKNGGEGTGGDLEAAMMRAPSSESQDSGVGQEDEAKQEDLVGKSLNKDGGLQGKLQGPTPPFSPLPPSLTPFQPLC